MILPVSVFAWFAEDIFILIYRPDDGWFRRQGEICRAHRVAVFYLVQDVYNNYIIRIQFFVEHYNIAHVAQ